MDFLKDRMESKSINHTSPLKLFTKKKKKIESQNKTPT